MNVSFTRQTRHSVIRVYAGRVRVLAFLPRSGYLLDYLSTWFNVTDLDFIEWGKSGAERVYWVGPLSLTIETK